MGKGMGEVGYKVEYIELFCGIYRKMEVECGVKNYFCRKFTTHIYYLNMYLYNI